MRKIRARHAIDIVEAAYSLAGTDHEWMAHILEVATPDLEYGHGSYGFDCKITPTAFEVGAAYAERSLDPRFAAVIAQVNREVPGAVHDILMRSAVKTGSVAEHLGVDHAATKQLRTAGSASGIMDAFSVFVHDGEGYAVNLTGPSGTLLESAPRVRGIWRRIGLHLAAGLRLRRRLAERRERLDAVLGPDGTVKHAEGAARERSPREALTRAVRDMERARTGEQRSSPDHALELWRGLVAGEWSLVEQWESDGKRYVAAYRNHPDAPDPRALTARERAVLHYAARGESNKEIAFTLGISVDSAAAATSLVMKKLGCTRRIELSAFARPESATRLSIDGAEVLALPAVRDTKFLERLSPSEREVATLLVTGATNAAIARARRTSPNTVANQVRRILEKLGVDSRAGAAAVLTQGTHGAARNHHQ